MKKWVRAALTVMVCLALMAVSVPAAQSGTVYFMAVNEKLMELKRSNMPVMVSGTLYVPTDMFSFSDTGVNLGVSATFNTTRNQILVYSGTKQLVFDIGTKETYGADGSVFPEPGMVRNSTAYIPLARVCDYFKGEIAYSITITDYGRLIRVVNAAAVLGDAAFINAADTMLRSALAAYQKAETPQNPEPSVSVPPVLPPTPSMGSGAAVYPAFTLKDPSGAGGVMDALERQDCRGLFFFTGEQLAGEDDLVREVLGRGHFVGLQITVAEHTELSDALEELSDAQRTLTAVAHCRAAVVLAEGADDEIAAGLEEMGLVCWKTTADGRGLTGTVASRAGELMKAMTGGSDARNYLLLDDGVGSLLSGMLSAILEEEYHLRMPVAPEL